jgi:tRNA (cmo5U34)-methyltransferase
MTTHWTFENTELAKGFDPYVKGQLPWYDLATGLVTQVCENYLPTSGGRLYDIGASTGNVTNSMRELLQNRNVETISLENSESMCGEWSGFGELVCTDALGYEFQEFDVAVCFLTLMFLPVKDLHSFWDKLVSKCRQGGCIILVDKFEAPSGYAGTVIRRMTLRQKLNSGVSPEEIIEKELSLSGVQRPLSSKYKTDSCFFKVGEFEGYIYEPL